MFTQQNPTTCGVGKKEIKMGHIAPLQKMAGLQPATKQARVLLDEVQRCAVEIIKIAELEKNGIHDDDAFDHVAMKWSHAFLRLRAYYKYEHDAGRKAAAAKYATV
jgi:hypothetical protein